MDVALYLHVNQKSMMMMINLITGKTYMYRLVKYPDKDYKER